MSVPYAPTMAEIATRLDALPALERAVFLAVATEGSSYAAAAATLNVTVAEVEQALARALVMLDQATPRYRWWTRWRRWRQR